MTKFSLAGRRGCRLFYDMRLASEPDFDVFGIYAGLTTFASTFMDGWSGSTGGVFVSESSDFSSLDNRAGITLRFWLFSDSAIAFDGVYLDNVAMRCLAASGGPTSRSPARRWRRRTSPERPRSCWRATRR